MPFMYCDPPTTIAHIRAAADETHAGSGSVTLKNGASFEITTPTSKGPDGEDAGPTARMAIVGDVNNSLYMYILADPGE